MRARATCLNPIRFTAAFGTPLAGTRLACGLALWLMCALAAAAVPAAPPTGMAAIGWPPVHNFDAADYGGATQNWAVTQGADGVIYVGNSEDGVLAFDGSQWQRIPVRDKLVVRSLATAPGGRVYVGTVGDFGYLAPDVRGQLHFVSLLDQVPAADRDFEDVWNIYANGSAVYFATTTRLFVLQDGRIRVLTPSHPVHMTFMIDGVVYVREEHVGLLRLDGDRFEPVPGGQRFADERVYALLPWHGPHAKPGELLAATRSHGWFRFDGNAWQPWPTTADAALVRAENYAAIWLADGHLAVSTLKDGLYLLDAEGRLIGHLDHTNGLASDIVLALYQDRQRGLWLATGSGVTRVDFNSTLTHFGEDDGLYGATLAITRHAGTLYAGTSEGVFRLANDAAGGPRFVRLRGAPGQNWSFASVDGQLLTAGNDGVFAIQPNGNTHLVLQPRPGHTLAAQALLHSTRDPTRVFVGYQDGVGTVRWTGKQWVDEGRIIGIGDVVATLAMDAQGHVWGGLTRGGVIRLILPPDWRGPGDPRTVTVTHFGDRAGVPKGVVQPVTLAGRLILISNAGVYRFDVRTQRFGLDPAFTHLFPEGPRSVQALSAGPHGRLWMYTENPARGIRETGYAAETDGRWGWHVAALRPLKGETLLSIYPDGDDALWLGAYKQLFRLDRTREPVDDPAAAALIRAVTTTGGVALPIVAPARAAPRVPWARNDLRFQFALPSFDDLAATAYQVYLQGADPGWSSWGHAAYRDYTNLPAGRYVFHVRGRDVYGHVSRAVSFAFRILPPWYRTPWAWIAWSALAALTLTLFVRWRSAALRHRNRALETLVELRTAELAQANEALAKNNAALAEQSVTDPLTGLKNRRYLYDHIAQGLAVARRRQGDPARAAAAAAADLIFVMVDIDHFKAVNDRYGHGAGDHVLRQLADTLRGITRGSDIPIRWGGEEFLIVARFAMPGAGPAFAERVRSTVAAHAFDLGEGQSIHCTCSIGFATYPLFEHASAQPEGEQLVNMADACLYAAKVNGRDAWAGLSPMAMPPAGDPLEVLRATLAALPAPGALAVRASWLAPSA